MNFPIPIISVVVGAVLLFFGRKLFWLFVAAIGFAIGIELTSYLVHQPPPWLALIVALGLGLLGALIAIFLQKIAIAVAGFVAGGRLALAAASTFFVDHANYPGITFLIGGILGAILLLVLFDWALILLSSVEGAHLIGSAIRLPATGATILLIALVVLGIVVQASMMGRGRARAIG